MNWIGQKVSMLSARLGSKIGHAMSWLGSKLNHPVLGHLTDSLNNIQHQYRVENKPEDAVYEGARAIKRVIEVPQRIGAFMQWYGDRINRRE